MAEILGLGLSHYPPLSGLDDDMAGVLRWTLDDPDIPADAKDPQSWPLPMRQEWGSDQGRSAAAVHRASLVANFDRMRRVLDDFAPDVVLIFGDDQYENFREDLIPPFAVLAYDDLTVRPWRQAQGSSDMVDKTNVWDEPGDTTLDIRCRPDIARYLVEALLAQNIDVSYAYTSRHHPGLPHAFLNAVLYLDYHRVGFPYAVLPFSVNCYGRRVISYQGFLGRFGDDRPPDPPSPTPARMMDVGAAAARALESSPWRVALMASASWSHAFSCDKTWRLYPDVESDRKLHGHLAAGDWTALRKTTLADIEDAGQVELLNWFALFGAMEELEREPTWTEFVESYVFNSNKVFAAFCP